MGPHRAAPSTCRTLQACSRHCARQLEGHRGGPRQRDHRHPAGLRDKAYGIAVDVGSTTIAAHLCDLQTGEVVASAGMMNPQIRFGEDLMSRVSYVMMNPGGDREMTAPCARRSTP
jgi:hypothetical protein